MTIDELAHKLGIPTSTVRALPEQRTAPSPAARGPDGLLQHLGPRPPAADRSPAEAEVLLGSYQRDPGSLERGPVPRPSDGCQPDRSQPRAQARATVIRGVVERFAGVQITQEDI